MPSSLLLWMDPPVPATWLIFCTLNSGKDLSTRHSSLLGWGILGANCQSTWWVIQKRLMSLNFLFVLYIGFIFRLMNVNEFCSFGTRTRLFWFCEKPKWGGVLKETSYRRAVSKHVSFCYCSLFIYQNIVYLQHCINFRLQKSNSVIHVSHIIWHLSFSVWLPLVQ